jgi:hypothetical protein
MRKAAAEVEVSDGSLRIVSGCPFGATASAAWHAPSAAGSSGFSFVACRLVSCCLHVVLSQRAHIATDDGRSVSVRPVWRSAPALHRSPSFNNPSNAASIICCLASGSVSTTAANSAPVERVFNPGRKDAHQNIRKLKRVLRRSPRSGPNLNLCWGDDQHIGTN